MLLRLFLFRAVSWLTVFLPAKETHMTRVALLLSLIFALPMALLAADGPFDVLIINAHIIDGTGSPWYSADIGIRNGRIAAIGKLA